MVEKFLTLGDLAAKMFFEQNDVGTILLGNA